MKQQIPQTPTELLNQLRDWFPGFDQQSSEGHASHSATYHAVLMDFRPFYRQHVNAFSERQLKTLAGVVNAAAESADALANAFDTCFFERMGPEAKPLRQFLSAKAKNLARGRG